MFFVSFPVPIWCTMGKDTIDLESALIEQNPSYKPYLFHTLTRVSCEGEYIEMGRLSTHFNLNKEQIFLNGSVNGKYAWMGLKVYVNFYGTWLSLQLKAVDRNWGQAYSAWKVTVLQGVPVKLRKKTFAANSYRLFLLFCYASIEELEKRLIQVEAQR